MSDVDNNAILKVEGLKTWFPAGGGLTSARRYVRAVDGVDLSVSRGKTLGLVGESGSGKTTVGRSILRLAHPSAGRIVFDGKDVLAMSIRQMRRLCGRVTMIFQDPFGSLNPRMTVGSVISEPLKVHRIVPRRERGRRVAELLERVGLAPSYASRYPHEFSGGQRQRIGIARALASQPEFIICDEPVSALDVSIQAQILNLLSDLQEQLGLSYLFIAHNLAVVEHFADEVAVMYLGRIVEIAGRDEIYSNPRHPYTESLLSAVPRLVPQPGKTRIRLPGEMPSAIYPPNGCPFHPRCPLTRELAMGLPAGETATIMSDGQATKVVKSCTCRSPRLASLKDTSGHMHSCILRQG